MSTEDRDLVSAWERSVPVEVDRDRPPTSVLSIRVPTGLLELLESKAASRGVAPSQLARELLDDALKSDLPRTRDDIREALIRALEGVRSRRLLDVYASAILRSSWIDTAESSPGTTASSSHVITNMDRPTRWGDDEGMKSSASTVKT